MNIEQKLITARTSLIIKHPFFGVIATQMPFVRKNDLQFKTMATDMKNIYYSDTFVEQQDNFTLQFVVAHEILHMIFDHLIRRDNRNPKGWNYAADFVVNGLLHDEFKMVPPMALYDAKYAGMTAEQVYDLLKKKNDEELSQLGSQMDDHLDMDSLTDVEKAELRELISDKVTTAMTSCGDSNLASSIRNLIDNMRAPKIDWKSALRADFESMIRGDFSYVRPNKKTQQSGVVMPGRVKEPTVEVFVAIDTSGSINDEILGIFLSEVRGILDCFGEYHITLCSWDTSIHNISHYETGDGTDIATYVPGGGGGTDPQCVFDYLDKEALTSKVVFFTDGEFSLRVNEHTSNPLWAVYANPKLTLPFGRTIHIS